MNNEQEIEKILEVMHSGIFLTHSDCAIALVSAGIGDKKQAVKEAFEKLKERGRDENTYESDVRNWTIQWTDIDELFTELYGAGE